MEYEYATAGMGDVVLDDGFGQSLYHYGSPVPSSGHGRRAPSLADEYMSDDPPVQAVAPAPAPTPPAPVKKEGNGLFYLIGLGVGSGALTAAGVYGLMRWKKCPAAQDPTSLAQIAGVGGAATVLAAMAAKKFLGKKTTA